MVQIFMQKNENKNIICEPPGALIYNLSSLPNKKLYPHSIYVKYHFKSVSTDAFS